MIQSLSRGIAVLRALAASESATVAEIAGAVGLNRGTVYRLLNTLTEHGTVVRIDGEGRYRIGPRAQSFAWGYDREDRLQSEVSTILSRTGRALRWPLSVTEAIGAELVLRATTDHETSMVFHRKSAGEKFPLTFPAAGWVVLAFSPPHIRLALIELAERLPMKPYHRIWETREALLTQLDRVARRGYALKHQVYTDNSAKVSQVAAIAVPIRSEAGILHGALAVRYFLRTLSDEEAVAALLPTLRRTADEIGAVYHECRGEPAPPNASS
jgi:DNA-binding IclR family transcriptional regulator